MDNTSPENLWEMESSGKHSGRCCPKSEVDERPDSATDAEDFWALANYDRFKGSRKANVEIIINRIRFIDMTIYYYADIHQLFCGKYFNCSFLTEADGNRKEHSVRRDTRDRKT